MVIHILTVKNVMSKQEMDVIFAFSVSSVFVSILVLIYLAFYYAIKKQKKNGDVYEDCTNRQKRGR